MTESPINSYRDLVVWQKAMQLSLEIYAVTKGFPAEERFGLTNQLRRAAVSVPSNIAEGYGRGSQADYLRFLRTARGSLAEIDTQMLIAEGLHFVDHERYQQVLALVNECGRILAGLIRRLESES